LAPLNRRDCPVKAESGTSIAGPRKAEKKVSGAVIGLVHDQDLAEEPATRISTPLIYLSVDASLPGLPIPSKAAVSNDGGLI
jgi:hypothetical protein